MKQLLVINAAAMPVLLKAFGGGPGLAGRMGLSQEVVVDKNGRHVRHWVRHDRGQSRFSAHGHYQKTDQPEKATEAHSFAGHPGAREAYALGAEKLKHVQSTHTMHGDGTPHGYTPERKELHEKIISKFLNPDSIKKATPAKGEKPRMTFLGGRGGSGKSGLNGLQYAEGKVAYDKHKAIVLDPDAVKEQLPEYQGWNAHQVHEESGHIMDEISRRATAAGVHQVHDVTMKTPGQAEQKVDDAHAAGYTTAAHFMHLSRHEAMGRAVGRAMRGTERARKDHGEDTTHTGRQVPPHVIQGNIHNEANFDNVRKKVHEWSFHDNHKHTDGTNGPKLIAYGTNPHHAYGDPHVMPA